MSVPGRIDKCVRVMLLVNTESEQSAIRHVYMDGAQALRPDLRADTLRADAPTKEGTPVR
jgi:chorismate mutase